MIPQRCKALTLACTKPSHSQPPAHKRLRGLRPLDPQGWGPLSVISGLSGPEYRRAGLLLSAALRGGRVGKSTSRWRTQTPGICKGITKSSTSQEHALPLRVLRGVWFFCTMIDTSSENRQYRVRRPLVTAGVPRFPVEAMGQPTASEFATMSRRRVR